MSYRKFHLQQGDQKLVYHTPLEVSLTSCVNIYFAKIRYRYLDFDNQLLGLLAATFLELRHLVAINSIVIVGKLRGHLLSTYAKFSEKLTFLTLDTHTYVCLSRG